MKTHAHTLVQLCASTWVWSLGVWALPLNDHLHAEHRGTVEIPLPDESPLGVIPEGGSFMVSGLDGSYRFGLQSEDQWRMESRNADGIVNGRYVYQNPEGQTVDISYNAGPKGFIAEGDAIPGGRAPLVDAPIDDKANQFIQATLTAVNEEEEVKSVAYGALQLRDTNLDLQPVVVRAGDNVPYGALALSGLPQYAPLWPGFRNSDAYENEKDKAIIVEAEWPPQLTFEPIRGTRIDDGNIYDPDDIIYGPALWNGEELKSGVILA